MGYRLAIVPGLLFKTVIGACEAVLRELRETRRHPTSLDHMTVRDAFRRVGADDWDRLRDAFREPGSRAAE